ncbi:MAG: MBL fold metallo-hydrolase [Geminicoccaceae bacterium]
MSRLPPPPGLRELAEAPPVGTWREWAPGLLWLRLRLPFALDHVNVWLLDDGDSWTVIDGGVHDAATNAVWDTVLAGPLAGRPVGRVLATHFHPDHVGQCGRLVALTGAPLLMSRLEWLYARWLSLDLTEEFVTAGDEHYRRGGMPDALIDRSHARGNAYAKGVVPPPASYQRVAAGDRLRLAGSDWEVIIGEGHAPEQVTLWSPERNILIAADQILPRISPVVGVWATDPESDPLGDFLTSLERYRHLPEDCTVLPSHGLPFVGLHQRREQLARHHDERLDAVLGACVEPHTAYEVLRVLFPRELDAHQTGFALAETLAHLNRLRRAGTIERSMREDGVSLYRRT